MYEGECRVGGLGAGERDDRGRAADAATPDGTAEEDIAGCGALHNDIHELNSADSPDTDEWHDAASNQSESDGPGTRTDAGSAEIGEAKARCLQICRAEARIFHIGTSKVRSFQICRSKARSFHVGKAKARIFQVCRAEARIFRIS